MAIKVQRFEIGKDTNIVPINRFLRRTGLRRANLLDTRLVTLGRDRSILVFTYDDTTAPFVVSSFPGQGADNVATGTTLVFVFSEPIQPPVSSDVVVEDVTSDTTIDTGDYTLDTSDVGDENGGILRIVDSGSYLTAGKIFRVTLKSTIKDEAGNRMAENFVLTFSTVPDPSSTTNPTQPLAQRVLMTAGNRELILTTKGKYTSEPVINITIERNKVFGSIKDGTLVQNPDTTWNFVVVASHKAKTGGQYVHSIESTQS